MTTQASSGGSLVPRWLERLASFGWRVLAVVALGFVLMTVAVELATVTASVIVALIAAVALAPVVFGLRRRGAGSTRAAAFACLLALVVLALAIVLVAVAFVPHLPAVRSAVVEGVQELRADLVAIGLPEFVIEGYDRFVAAISDVIAVDPAALVAPILTIGTVGILGGFLTFFVLSDGDDFWAWAMRAMSPRQATTVTASATAGLVRLSRYLRRTALLASIDAVTTLGVLLVIGVPIAGPLAVVTFVGGLIPYLGAVISATIVVLATLAYVGPVAALVVLTVIVATGIVADRLLAGTTLGRGVDVHPLLVLVAIPTGAALFGVIGLIALLPVTVFLLAVGGSVGVALGMPGPGERHRRAGAGGVPLWLERLAQWSWRGLVLIGLIWLLIRISIELPGIVIPAVLAGVLAATLVPVTNRLRSIGWPVGRAAGVTAAGASLVVGGALVVTIAFSVGPFSEIVATAIEGADETRVELVRATVADIGSTLVANLEPMVRGLLGALFIVVLALLITYFLLRDGGALWQRVLARIEESRRSRVDAIGRHAVQILGGYMTGTALISLFGAVTSALIMVLLGLPLAVPIGVLTFFGGFIPYIGSFVTTAMATLVAIAVGTTADVIVLLIYTVVFNIVQGNFVTPLVYGRTMSLHPAVILLAIPAGGEIAGLLGMFLVVPFVAILAATLPPFLRLVADTPEPGTPTVMEAAPTVESAVASE